MFDFHKQIRGLLPNEGDHTEGVHDGARTAFSENSAQGVGRNSSGGVAAALLDAGVRTDLADVDEPSLIGKRAGGGEEGGDAGKDGRRQLRSPW